MNTYLIHNLLANPELVANAGLFLLKQTGNDKDVLATRVSYQLNLRRVPALPCRLRAPLRWSRSTWPAKAC